MRAPDVNVHCSTCGQDVPFAGNATHTITQVPYDDAVCQLRVECRAPVHVPVAAQHPQ